MGRGSRRCRGGDWPGPDGRGRGGLRHWCLDASPRRHSSGDVWTGCPGGRCGGSGLHGVQGRHHPGPQIVW
ncbi:hypothetical protein CKO22_19455, partial [Thiococcus pfennigii]|nr:hypothetical protein [Thiococcus pfennigii]